MLVLSRHEGEEIQISDDIRIVIVRLKGNTVRIGIVAPIEIRVVRGELADTRKPEAASAK